ncbi:MAG: DNA-methyltransferase [Chlamydiales bacterium]
MRTWPDKCVDLVLTDPPYGIGQDYESYQDSPENLKALIDGFMPQILRISKCVLLTCGITNMWMYPKPDWVLSWNILGATSSGPWGFVSWSPILAYGKCPYLANGLGRRPTTIDKTETAEINGHPFPKPITAWKKILLRGSVKETDIICDPFMGSGTTAVACIEHKRQWIGIEIEPKYVAIAQSRIDAEMRQLKLF